MRVKENVSFKDLTTLKVGGVARTVHFLESQKELIECLTKEEGEFIILGGGSNVLAHDELYNGTVYVPQFKNITKEEHEKEIVVTTEAGANWDTLVSEVVSHGRWGVENLSGIPGTVGGAVFQNIGAYGAVLSDTVRSVRVYDCKHKIIQEFSKDECVFGYRTSIFKKEAGRYVILAATFILNKEGVPNLVYKDLSEYFKRDVHPTLEHIRMAVLEIRKKKFPDLSQYGTAGSFFLNPVVSRGEVEEFKKKYPTMPLFDLPEGGVKVPIAWILDNVIHAKEMHEGDAFVWKDQALVIATKEGATASDVRTLQKHIQEKVLQETGITIVPEVRLL